MPDHRWKLGYNTLTWNETRDPDLEAVATTIRDAGWEGIELLDPDLGWYGPPSRLRGILQRVGIPAIAVLGVVQIDDARRRRVDALDSGDVLAGSVVLVGVGAHDDLRRHAVDGAVRVGQHDNGVLHAGCRGEIGRAHV